MADCADCGAEIEPRRDHAEGWVDCNGLTVCRSVIIDFNGTPRLQSADYHYVEGETQRHWKVPE